MEDLNKEFQSFMKELESKLTIFDKSIYQYPIDHACFRVSNEEEYQKYLEIFRDLSALHSSKEHHGRTFNYFLLKRPLTYNSLETSGIEFSQPGGSDDYTKGFQHIEFYTTLKVKELKGNQDEINNLLFSGRFGDEEYIKWPDKKVIKTTRKSLFEKMVTDRKSKKEILG